MKSKLLEFIKVLFWPILFGIGQIFVCGLFMIVYMLQNSNVDWNDSANNSLLSNYINEQSLLIVIVTCIIFIPIFLRCYKKYRMDVLHYDLKDILLIFIFSFLLSSVLNFIIISVKSFMKIDMISNLVTFSLLISTGILGPILEEFLFRGVVYGKLKFFLKEKVAFYLSIFIFAVFHTGGFSQILFAGFIGYFLTYIYDKYHDIKLSILAHIVVNITSIVLSPFILLMF